MFGSQSIPAALTQAGYSANDEVVVITFDSTAERVYIKGKNPTVGTMQSLRLKCRGSTNMCGAIELLVSALGNDVTNKKTSRFSLTFHVFRSRFMYFAHISCIGVYPAVHVIVISDGAIGDQRATRQAALGAIETLSGPQRRTSVTATLIRFLSR